MMYSTRVFYIFLYDFVILFNDTELVINPLLSSVSLISEFYVISFYFNMFPDPKLPAHFKELIHTSLVDHSVLQIVLY